MNWAVFIWKVLLPEVFLLVGFFNLTLSIYTVVRRPFFEKALPPNWCRRSSIANACPEYCSFLPMMIGDVEIPSVLLYVLRVVGVVEEQK